MQTLSSMFYLQLVASSLSYTCVYTHCVFTIHWPMYTMCHVCVRGDVSVGVGVGVGGCGDVGVGVGGWVCMCVCLVLCICILNCRPGLPKSCTFS